MIKSLFRWGIYVGVFCIVAAFAGYFTLRWIVKNEDVVIVPDLVGKDVVYALEILTDLGLNTKVSDYEYRADVPKNHVAYQEPRAGTEVKKDRDIRIVVSKGPRTVPVPELVGFDLRQATIIVEDNGLILGRLTEVHGDGEVRGAILSQVPAPGSVVQRGTAVDLLIDLGRRPIEYSMLKLEGLFPEDAILQLERYQLSIGRIRYVQRDDLPQGVIIEQDPAAGYPVISGDPVSFTVNRAEAVVIQDRGLYLFHHSVDNGLLKRHIRLRVNAFGLLYDLFDVFSKPGEDIWMLLPRDGSAAFFLYDDEELVLTHSFALGGKDKTRSEVVMENF
jgi:beta-lactam-binding protein with PASTA domain